MANSASMHARFFAALLVVGLLVKEVFYEPTIELLPIGLLLVFVLVISGWELKIYYRKKFDKGHP